MSADPAVFGRGLAVGPAADVQALVELDLAVEPGERLALIGPNGSGKTALLATLALVRPPLGGVLQLFGRDVAHTDDATASALRRRIGAALGDGPWLAGESAAENLALPLRIQGEAEGAIGAVVAEFLAWLGLGDRAAVPLAALSRGERRLLATARAAVVRPDLLLLDEPLEGLDEHAAARTARLVGELADLGSAVLVASSNADTARRLGCESVHLAAGRLRVGTTPLRAAS
jgi:ABC-type ATPase involved in cell division